MANLFRPTFLGSVAAPIKRKAYFAFHFDDIMRVNNVRNAWKITHPDSSLNRSFFDSSLWESNEPLQPLVHDLPAHLRGARAPSRHELGAVHLNRRPDSEPA